MDPGSCNSHPKGGCPNCAIQRPRADVPLAYKAPYQHTHSLTDAQSRGDLQSGPGQNHESLRKSMPNVSISAAETRSTIANVFRPVHGQWHDQTRNPSLPSTQERDSPQPPFFQEPMVSPIHPRTHIYRMGEYGNPSTDLGGGTIGPQHSFTSSPLMANAGTNQSGGLHRGTSTGEGEIVLPQSGSEPVPVSSTQSSLFNPFPTYNRSNEDDSSTSGSVPQQQRIQQRKDRDDHAGAIRSVAPPPRDPNRHLRPTPTDQYGRQFEPRGSPTGLGRGHGRLNDNRQGLKSDLGHGPGQPQNPGLPRRFHSYDPSSPGDYDNRPTPFRAGLQQQSHQLSQPASSQPPRSSWPQDKRREVMIARSPSPPQVTPTAALHTSIAASIFGQPSRPSATTESTAVAPPPASSTPFSKPNKLQKRSQPQRQQHQQQQKRPQQSTPSNDLPLSPFPPRPSPQQTPTQQQQPPPQPRRDFIPDQRHRPPSKPSSRPTVPQSQPQPQPQPQLSHPQSPFPPRPPPSHPVRDNHQQPAVPQPPPRRLSFQPPAPPPPPPPPPAAAPTPAPAPRRRFSFQPPGPGLGPTQPPSSLPPSLTIRPPPHLGLHPPTTTSSTTTNPTPSTVQQRHPPPPPAPAPLTIPILPAAASAKKKQVRFDPTPMISPTPPPASAASSSGSHLDLEDPTNSDPESYTRDRDHGGGGHRVKQRERGKGESGGGGGGGGERRDQERVFVVADEAKWEDDERWSRWRRGRGKRGV